MTQFGSLTFGYVYVLVFLFGAVIGSFINVLIYRLPKGEDIVRMPSHCPDCGERLQWTELVPVVSFLFQKGRCRHCGAKISVRYPLVELMNAAAYVLIVVACGWDNILMTVLHCVFASCLLAAGWIDALTMKIPNGISYTVLGLGVAYVVLTGNFLQGILGAASIALPLFLPYLLTKGGAIGGGDIKLMAGAGLLLGPAKTVIAFCIACILGSVVHLIRMKFFHAGRKLALGPYLSAGLYFSLLLGNRILLYYTGNNLLS